MSDIEIWNGDCLVEMSRIPDHSIDMILCDLPYGTTSCEWDVVIPFDKLWSQYRRVIKPYHAIVLFSKQPFTSLLIVSNINWFKYCYVFKKSNKMGGFFNAKYRPLMAHEDICVFSQGNAANCASNLMPYFPQGIKECNEVKFNHDHTSDGVIGIRPNRSKGKTYIQKYTGYPTTVLEFDVSNLSLNRTEKSIDLMEYLIATYTQDGDTVLDNCCGSGSTLIACQNLGRKGIGIELDPEMCDVARKLIERPHAPIRPVSRDTKKDKDRPLFKEIGD